MLPNIAVTMGDPAGVGPEVIAAAWSDPGTHERCRPFVVGRPALLRRAAQMWKLPLRVVEIRDPEEAAPSPALLPCLAVGTPDADDTPPGAPSALGGQAAFDALREATDFALAGRVDAITTAPLNKAALWQAGHHYPGHTELLADWCGVNDFAMMLYLAHDATIRGSAGLAVVHATLHMALREVFEHLDTASVLAKAHLAHRFMLALKGSRPKIGVTALNPHAGETGLFGDEELRVIAPAVAQARIGGLDIEGPYPADTVMIRARDGDFDAVVAMYHDQGHIALKLLGMHRAVNVTLGLPIIRTSVAHGTAFDVAWQKKANPASMIEALRVAALLVNRREAEAQRAQAIS
ncbi:MAG: 4-hydroxythreonine-4-phosphate dehydrogenase PdxA [Planctomycetia bacterium]|nr:4-hydroxythreonine-4-phosphate dehydrogenase PdxA [Planctomycetia bacterium]